VRTLQALFAMEVGMCTAADGGVNAYFADGGETSFPRVILKGVRLCKKRWLLLRMMAPSPL
jgi:hypothetical protein